MHFQVSLQAQRASLEVRLEPYQLREVSLSSVIGGEDIFPLHGCCPQPQGLFSLEAGGNIVILCKNTTFSFLVKSK